MPAVKTALPSRTTAPDSGGRGTDHKLPTGGGGDGEWSNRPPERRGPRERLYRARVGLAVLMTTSVTLFVSLSSFYLWKRGHLFFSSAANAYISAWTPIAIPPLLWWNTALLVVSSVALELARQEYFREEVVMDEWFGISRPTLRRALPWEVVSLASACAFVAGQIYVWGLLQRQGVFLGSGPSSQFYYFLTGLHALHLVGGMIVLLWAMFAVFIGRSFESRQITVDITAWYWHAITVVWFGIFALLKICE